MNSLTNTLRFEGDMMWLNLADGRQLDVPLAYFPRLLHASPTQRAQYEISGGGPGLHWDELDEDISVEPPAHGDRRPHPHWTICSLKEHFMLLY